MACKYSFIIPMLNAEATLLRALDSIKIQGMGPNDYEVLAIDNGSQDGSIAIAADWGARVLQLERSGPAAARNVGIANADGEILIFLDADTVLAPSWLSAVDQKFQMPWVDCVQTPIRPAADGQTWMLLFRKAFISAKTNDEFHYMGHVFGSLPTFNTAALAVRRRALRYGRVSFAETFQRCEDTDFTIQLLILGAHAALATDSYALVYDDRTPWQYLLRSFRTGYYQSLVTRSWGGQIQMPFKLSRSPEVGADVGAFVALNIFVQRLGALVGSVDQRSLPKRQAKALGYLGNLMFSQLHRGQRMALAPGVRIVDLGTSLVLLDLTQNDRLVFDRHEREDFLKFMQGSEVCDELVHELAARRFILIDGTGPGMEI